MVGGGQAGLAAGYYLRRAGLTPGTDFVILDADESPGGSWQHMWDGLRLFSPATYSSLPGWMMPPWDDARLGFPPRTHVLDYLRQYESRYQLDVQRPHVVRAITRDHSADRLLVQADRLEMTAKFVLSATGTWTRPFWPTYSGARDFEGRQLHTAQYRSPEEFQGQRVIIVGGGNSGAQILAEVSRTADTTWVTPSPPRFLPDDVDGRVLFAAATARIEALRQGRTHAGVAGLGDVVMVASVREARARGRLDAHPCSPDSRAAASPGTTARLSTPTRSSGAPASAPSFATCNPSISATPGGECPSTDPRNLVHRVKRDCTSSGTATGPAQPRRPCSASAARPGPQPTRSLGRLQT